MDKVFCETDEETHQYPEGTVSLLAWQPGHLQSPFLPVSPLALQASATSFALFIAHSPMHLTWNVVQQYCSSSVEGSGGLMMGMEGEQDHVR